MIKITDFEVHLEQKKRWDSRDWTLTEELKPFNSKAPACRVFKYLNRPYPDGVNDDTLIDCSGVLPKLQTMEHIEKESFRDDLQMLLNFDIEHYGKHSELDNWGEGKSGQPLYYAGEVIEYFATDVMLTVNALHRDLRIDRATAERHTRDLPEQYKPHGKIAYFSVSAVAVNLHDAGHRSDHIDKWIYLNSALDIDIAAYFADKEAA